MKNEERASREGAETRSPESTDTCTPGRVLSATRTHSYEAVWICERCERIERGGNRPKGWQKGVIACVCDLCIAKSRRAAKRARMAA